MGLVISFLGVEWKRRPPPPPPSPFCALRYFSLPKSGADTDTERQTQWSSDTARLHLLQTAPVTSCLSLFLWNFWVAWCIWRVWQRCLCAGWCIIHYARLHVFYFLFLYILFYGWACISLYPSVPSTLTRSRHERHIVAVCAPCLKQTVIFLCLHVRVHAR